MKIRAHSMWNKEKICGRTFYLLPTIEFYYDHHWADFQFLWLIWSISLEVWNRNSCIKKGDK